MAIRKSVTNLTPQEKTQFISGVKQLKNKPPFVLPGLTLTATNMYDAFVEMHAMSMATLTPPGNPTGRNAAHQGPAFLPWHREFILRFERELQIVLGDNNFGLPYWDWASDSALDDINDPNRTAMVIWRNDFLGGNGDPADSDHVKTGPFAHDPADPTDSWTIFDNPGVDPAPFLKRAFGRGSAGTLPTQNDVNSALQIDTYDRSPWNRPGSGSNSFRNHFEGWNPVLGLHNRVHVWIGRSMSPGTSPNDPVFFLHHCNCDRIWGLWQLCHPSVPYAPADNVNDAPEGHRLNDRMFPWTSSNNRRISDLLDFTGLGYDYEDFHRRFIKLRRSTGDQFVSNQVTISDNCDTRNDTNATVFLPATTGETIRARFDHVEQGADPGEVTVTDSEVYEMKVT